MSPLSVPPGLVRSNQPQPGHGPYNIPWTNVSRWEPWFSDAAEESSVPAELIAAMAIVETGANHIWPPGTPKAGQLIEVWDNHPQDGPSVGIMQVKPQLWGSILPGADAYTPQGSIRLGARLMRNFIQQRGSWQLAIEKDYHPGRSPQDITPQLYINTIQSLIDEMGGVSPQPGVGCPLSVPPPYDGTAKMIDDVVFHPDKRTVRAIDAGLNRRQYATRDSCQVREPLAAGEAVDVLYWVHGQPVDGEDRWWVADDGARIWAGGTHETPALAAEADAEAPVASAAHVLDIITGGKPWTADFGFGMPNTDEFGNPLEFYHYGVGHGTTAAHHHTGIDVNMPLGTVLHTPLAGVVRCVGNSGQGDWGQSCGAFPDTFTNGVGNVTILTDSGLKLTFGHVNQPLVGIGQRVTAGQPVVTSGGMVGPHLHLDVAIDAPQRVNLAIAHFPGSYFLLDPVPAIQAVLDGEDPTDGVSDGCAAFAPPEFDGAPKVVNNVTFHPQRTAVEIEVEGLNARQFANRQACQTRPPFGMGETVDVLYWIRGEPVAGEDRWWVAADGTRIWSGGTVEKPLGV